MGPRADRVSGFGGLVGTDASVYLQLDVDLIRQPRWLGISPWSRCLYLSLLARCLEMESPELQRGEWTDGSADSAIGAGRSSDAPTCAEMLAELAGPVAHLVDVSDTTITVHGFAQRYEAMMRKRNTEATRKRRWRGSRSRHDDVPRDKGGTRAGHERPSRGTCGVDVDVDVDFTAPVSASPHGVTAAVTAAAVQMPAQATEQPAKADGGLQKKKPCNGGEVLKMWIDRIDYHGFARPIDPSVDGVAAKALAKAINTKSLRRKELLMVMDCILTDPDPWVQANGKNLRILRQRLDSYLGPLREREALANAAAERYRNSPGFEETEREALAVAEENRILREAARARERGEPLAGLQAQA